MIENRNEAIKDYAYKTDWLLCPVCSNKTRTKVHLDTILIKFPLYCHKCRQETLINVEKFIIVVIKEPEA